jgi:hypothetical protein
VLRRMEALQNEFSKPREEGSLDESIAHSAGDHTERQLEMALYEVLRDAKQL